MDKSLRKELDRLLGGGDAHHPAGSRLLGDAARLLGRVRRLISMDLIASEADFDALELACFALQLPLRARSAEKGSARAAKPGRNNLKERAESAAELLVGLLGDQAGESLLERTTMLLSELPQRTPMLDEAKVLADALTLDDFGVSGLFLQAIQLGAAGAGVQQVAEGAEKREQYAYWDARLKDGFHFEPVRRIAQRRLKQARLAAEALAAELREDAGT